MKKILFLRKFSNFDENYLSRSLSEYFDLIFPNNFDNIVMGEYIKDVEVCVGNSITKDLFNKARRLEIFQIPGVGINLLDLNLFKKSDIIIGNSHSSSVYVAEYAVSMALSLIKKIHLHDSMMRKGEWFRPTGAKSDEDFMSDTIIGKTIGIFGYGSIGQNIAKMCSSFGCKILYSNKRSSNTNIKSVSFDILTKESDILFISAPLTESTRGVFNDQVFNNMKESSYLINVSRAEIVIEGSLFSALIENKIRGAGSDVWYNYKSEKDGGKYPSKRFDFHLLNNILLSPYRAGYIFHKSPHLDGVIENLIYYHRTGSLKYTANIDNGY
jgi:phosphoglycerate dehydrogenase-like enzyme